MRTWLTDRVRDVEQASIRHDASYLSEPVPDCAKFLLQFEKRLNDQLHLKNFLPFNHFTIPIERGCFEKASQFVQANGVNIDPTTTEVRAKTCECAMMILHKNKLWMLPTFDSECVKQSS